MMKIDPIIDIFGQLLFRPCQEKIVPLKNFSLGQKFSEIVLSYPENFCPHARQNLVCLIFHQHYMYPTA